jgi:hypothetical protein
MERNRRVAKGYVRSPAITVGGGKEGFDGLRIGLQGFGNPQRDKDTERAKTMIGGWVNCFPWISCNKRKIFAGFQDQNG